MTWFEDLTPYSYLRARGFAASTPALNVGWLDGEHPYPHGAASNDLVRRLRDLADHASTYRTRGWHACNLCQRAPGPSVRPQRGDAEIRVVAADGTRYAAPTLVVHYVTDHNYAPPQAFVDAVLRNGDIDWQTAYEADLCLGCGSTLLRLAGLAGHFGDCKGKPSAVWFRCATCQAEYVRRRHP